MRDIDPPCENSTSYVLDDQIGYLLRLASQRHAALFQASIPDDVTPTQFSALMRLAKEGQCSQNHLGRLAGMDAATVKGVVDRLRAKELIRIARDPADKRRAVISLSQKGRDLISRLQNEGHRVTAQTLAPLNEAERQALLSALRKLI